MIEFRLPSPLQQVTGDDRLDRHGLRLLLKRDDLIHPDFPGNKWRKLRHNIEEATRLGAHTLLTFGGAYSNHLRATAAAGHHFGFATIGVVRGEQHLPLNPTLAAATAHGMTLTYVTRTDYRRKTDPEFLAALHARFGDFYPIPEGGANPLGVRGCADIPTETAAQTPYDILCCATGTGTTLAGIASALPPGHHATGFAVLKGATSLPAEVTRLLGPHPPPDTTWTLQTDYHFGGYAKHPPTLKHFAADFAARHGIHPDLTYEAKMLAGIYSLAARHHWPPATTLVAVLS